MHIRTFRCQIKGHGDPSSHFWFISNVWPSPRSSSGGWNCVETGKSHRRLPHQPLNIEAQPKTVWIYTYSHGIFRGSLKSNTSGLPKPPSTGCQGWGSLLHLQVWARPQAFHQVATHLKKSQWLTSLSRAFRFGIKGSINKIKKCEKVGMSSFSCWTWQDQDNYEKAILSKLEREDVFSFFRTMIQSEQ